MRLLEDSFPEYGMDWILPCESDKEATLAGLEDKGLIERYGSCFRMTAGGIRFLKSRNVIQF